MYGYIYETTNLINNKKYIGQHKCEYFDEAYFGSGKILVQAILKEGIENFTCKILDSINNVPTICESEEQLNLSEAYYIDYYGCVKSDNFYNLKPGGEGKSESGLTYIRNPQTGKCKKVSDNDLQDFLNMGYIIGGPIPSSDVIEKRRRSNTGKKRTLEQRLHISLSQKGKKLSEEHKQKLRKPKSTPNWRKGLITLVKDDIQISVKPEELQDYLNRGFIRGAKKHPPESHIKHVDANKNRCCVTIDGIHKKYPQVRDVDKYINDGYRIVGEKSMLKYLTWNANKTKTS